MADRHKVVIIGGGFGGLTAAQALRRADVDVTLIDRRNFHLFQPLLYQVATGRPVAGQHRRPAAVASSASRRTRKVILGEVTGFDVPGKAVAARRRAGAVRQPDRRRRGDQQLLRQAGVGGQRPRPEVRRGGDRNPPPGAVGVRGGRARFRTARTGEVPDVRRRRRRGRPGSRWPGRSASWPATPCATTSAPSTRPRPGSSWSRGATASSRRSTRSCRPAARRHSGGWASRSGRRPRSRTSSRTT